MLRGSSLLFLSSLVMSAPVASAQDQASQAIPSFTLSGMVTDTSKAPIGSVELLLGRHGEINRLFRTGNDGHFSFDGIPGGTVSLTARRLGYRARTITLEINDTTVRNPLAVVLQVIPGDVAPVLVEGIDSRLEAFYTHKRQSSFGRFMEQTEIERKRPVFVSGLFRTVAGAAAQPSGRFRNIGPLRECQPMLW